MLMGDIIDFYENDVEVYLFYFKLQIQIFIFEYESWLVKEHHSAKQYQCGKRSANYSQPMTLLQWSRTSFEFLDVKYET